MSRTKNNESKNNDEYIFDAEALSKSTLRNIENERINRVLAAKYFRAAKRLTDFINSHRLELPTRAELQRIYLTVVNSRENVIHWNDPCHIWISKAINRCAPNTIIQLVLANKCDRMCRCCARFNPGLSHRIDNIIIPFVKLAIQFQNIAAIYKP